MQPIMGGYLTQDCSRSFSPSEFELCYLHRAYFSSGGQNAARYAVSFREVLSHLGRAHNLLHNMHLRRVVHVDDLILAVACLDGHVRAWSDLVEQCEYAMYCRGLSILDESHALTHARRVLENLRRQIGESECAQPSLRQYVGAQPLHVFLSDLTLDRLHEWGVAMRVNRRISWVWNNEAPEPAVPDEVSRIVRAE